MRLEHYTNYPSKTSYAPSWDYCLGFKTLPINTEKLSKICLGREREIKKLPTNTYDGGKVYDGYTGLGRNSTTSRATIMPNVLEWDTLETNSLKKHVKSSIIEYNKQLGNTTPQYLWARCWVNILRFGQKIQSHLHSVAPSCYLSSHFTVQAQNTSTCYINPVNVLNDPEIFEEENIPGTLSIFPSYVPHYTTRHYSFTPRITIAMDIVVENREDNWILL